MSETQIGSTLLTVLLVAVALLWDRARHRAQQAELSRYASLTPQQRRKEDSARQRQRLLSEATAEERPAILERFAFLDSIEPLTEPERQAAYAKWSSGLPKKAVSPPIPSRPTIPSRTAPAPPDDQLIMSRSTFISVLRREIARTLPSLDDGSAPLADLLEASIKAGEAVMDRYLGVNDRPGARMTVTTARALSIGVLWEAMARQTGGLDPDISRTIRSYLANDPDSDFESTLLTSVLPKLEDGVFRTRLLSWQSRPWGMPWARRPEVVEAADALTEIGCGASGGRGPGYLIELHRDAPSRREGIFDHTFGPHEAELEPGSFDDVARAVMFLYLTSPTRVEERHRNYHELDASETSVWVQRGRERINLEAYAGVGLGIERTIPALIRLAASGLAWHAVDGSPAAG